MTSILVLPYPPSVNALYRAIPIVSRKTGKTIARSIKSRAYRKWETAGGLALNAQSNPSVIAAQLPSHFTVDITLNPPDLRRRDADNVAKAVQDLVCRWLGIDDSRVIRVAVTKGDPQRPNGRVTVRLGTPMTWREVEAAGMRLEEIGRVMI